MHYLGSRILQILYQLSSSFVFLIKKTALEDFKKASRQADFNFSSQMARMKAQKLSSRIY